MSERGGNPERVGDILDRVFRESGLLEQNRQTDLIEAWSDVAGADVARKTRVHSFRNGVFTVAVDSAPLRQELEVFQREELLAALRQRIRGLFVAELRFTVT